MGRFSSPGSSLCLSTSPFVFFPPLLLPPLGFHLDPGELLFLPLDLGFSPLDFLQPPLLCPPPLLQPRLFLLPFLRLPLPLFLPLSLPLPLSFPFPQPFPLPLLFPLPAVSVSSVSPVNPVRPVRSVCRLVSVSAGLGSLPPLPLSVSVSVSVSAQ